MNALDTILHEAYTKKFGPVLEGQEVEYIPSTIFFACGRLVSAGTHTELVDAIRAVLPSIYRLALLQGVQFGNDFDADFTDEKGALEWFAAYFVPRNRIALNESLVIEINKLTSNLHAGALEGDEYLGVILSMLFKALGHLGERSFFGAMITESTT